ncbi:acetyl-CoA carboxylase biotin carboxyl carrier protein [Botrimarina sp.]|uniref:acetyl-CoA carboxylase biotin carboxyl carrier protein n=1 Tax=Botrimarina sp. TaxID=2795802 RepID=UPI0032EBCF10
MENDATQSTGGQADSGAPTPSEVFDVRKVRRLVELMNDHDLSEIDLRQGEQRIRLRRGPDAPPMAAAPAAAPPQAPAAPPAAPSSPAPSAAPAAAATTINSPMVGTFYTSSSPDTAPFVKVGDQVGPDTPVCIIEAMKVFNEIPAEKSGKVAAVLVENGAAVEFGQPLFRLE